MLRPGERLMSRTHNVLFLCTGNAMSLKNRLVDIERTQDAVSTVG